MSVLHKRHYQMPLTVNCICQGMCVCYVNVLNCGGVWVGVKRRWEQLYKKGSIPMVWARDPDKEGIDGEGVGEVFKFNDASL